MQGGGIIRGKGHLAFVTDAFGNVVVVPPEVNAVITFALVLLI